MKKKVDELEERLERIRKGRQEKFRGKLTHSILFTLFLIMSVGSATSVVGMTWWSYIHFNGPLQGVVVTGAILITCIVTIFFVWLTCKQADEAFS